MPNCNYHGCGIKPKMYRQRNRLLILERPGYIACCYLKWQIVLGFFNVILKILSLSNFSFPQDSFPPFDFKPQTSMTHLMFTQIFRTYNQHSKDWRSGCPRLYPIAKVISMKIEYKIHSHTSQLGLSEIAAFEQKYYKTQKEPLEFWYFRKLSLI